MQSKATTVREYLAELPEDRRKALEAVRKVIRRSLGKGYEEGMQYGMIGYYVPHRVYPPGYHCDPRQPLPFAGMASQKNHMSLYLMCLYDEGDACRRFKSAWAKTGKKLDMGKCCIRFKKVDDLALDVIADAIQRMPAERFIEHYESAIKTGGKRTSTKTARSKVSRTPTSKKVKAKKAVVKRKTKAKRKKTRS